MVVHDFNDYGIAIHPDEADPPLIINPDAVLSATLALRCFQTRTSRIDPYRLFDSQFVSGTSVVTLITSVATIE